MTDLYGPSFQNASGFRFEAGNLGQVSVELQNFVRLNDLEALTDHRQRLMIIRTEQHFTFRERFEHAGSFHSPSSKANRCFLNLPVHASLFGPYFDRLVGGKLVPKPMPRCFVNVGHAVDKVRQLVLPFLICRDVDVPQSEGTER